MVVCYDIADDLHIEADRMVCHCLRVRESRVIAAVENHGIETVRELTACTGAGGGCTACHCALRQYLMAARRVCA